VRTRLAGPRLPPVPDYSVGEAAKVLGVSPDTVRRWIDTGQLAATRTNGGRRRVDGVDLSRFARSLHAGPDPAVSARESARNHFGGIVTKVVKDKVMSHVEVQAGPFRVVALVSREAVDDMDLAPGVIVDAVVKSTNVTIERPPR
jgi:molybdopterin-binding protein